MGLKKYFAHAFIPAPGTIYDRIYKLPGGHNLEYDIRSGQLVVRKYWDFVLEPVEARGGSYVAETGERIIELLKSAVKRRLMSDVPLGLLLSGGIDSTTISALAVEIVGRHQLRSFSVGFDDPSYDESFYIDRAASRLGTVHSHSILSLERAKDLMGEIVGQLDEPMGDSSLIPTYLLCRETRRHVTVALGGDGADEMFAGYDTFRALRKAQLYSRLVPRPLHRAIYAAVARLPTSYANMSLDFKIKRTLKGLFYPPRLWNPVWLSPLAPPELEELFREPVEIEQLYSEAIEQWDACRQDNLVDRTLQFYTKLYLQDDILVKVDRASMMNSLEVRAPYLDIEFVNLVRTIPHRYKIRGEITKFIFKRAVRNLLPRQIVQRPKKGFGMPIGRWFSSGGLRLEENSLLFEHDRRFVADCQREQVARRRDHKLFLWNYWLLTKYPFATAEANCH